MDHRRWYAVNVRSRHEKTVHSEFGKKGIESSLPLLSVTRQWSDRIKEIEVPWFNGYIFVKIDLNIQRFVVLETPGVVKFIPQNKNPISIPESQLYWLQKLISHGTSPMREFQIPVGSPIKILYGPFRGCDGWIKQKRSKTRIIVWLNSIMQGVSVEFESHMLGKL
jgi:transcription antitermination factor NusG